MSYYHDLITQKSWQELQQLGKKLPFVLIGGWAVYLYTKALKSKDIDILVNFEVLGKLKQDYDVSKNERLKKYEARKGEVQIDVYLPHYSHLGIPVETLLSKTVSLEGFTLLQKEYLLALKLFTLNQRGRSVKGRKDFLDILSLWQSGMDGKIIKEIIRQNNLTGAVKNFQLFLAEVLAVPELSINRHRLRRIKTGILKLLL